MRFTTTAAAAAIMATVVAAIPAELVQRQSTDPNACQPEGNGYGPPSSPNTDVGFENYPAYPAIARTAPTPPGYTQAFQNLNASVQSPNYVGLVYLTSYNTTQCAQVCNAAPNCQAFDIFFERDPVVDPAPACPNPAAQTDIKCTMFAAPVSAANATNYGQYRQNFHVVIAGSNGYNAAS